MFMFPHRLDKFSYTILEMLKLAPVTIDVENDFVILDDYPIKFNMISANAWGYIYEKYVGQTLEKEGWEVTYEGLNKGLLDGGIDLIATRENKKSYVQCKLKKGKMGKAHLSQILYKGGNRIFADHSRSEKELEFQLEFLLVVNSFEQNFRRNNNNFKTCFTPTEKITYPWLQYFLDHNFIQNKVKLKAREIRML